MRKVSIFMAVAMVLVMGCEKLAKVKQENATPVATVQGIVTDEFQSPIANANVKILIEGVWREGYVTDEQGVFVIPDIPAGSVYTVEIDASGYFTVQFSVNVPLPSNFFPTGNQVLDLGNIILFHDNGGLKGCFTIQLPNATNPWPATNATVVLTVNQLGSNSVVITGIQADANGCFDIAPTSGRLPASSFGNVTVNILAVKQQEYVVGTTGSVTVPYSWTLNNLPLTPDLTTYLGYNTMTQNCAYAGNPIIVNLTQNFDRCNPIDGSCLKNSSANNSGTGITDNKVIRLNVKFDQVMDMSTSPNFSCDGCAGVVTWGWYWSNDFEGYFLIEFVAGSDDSGQAYKITANGSAANYCGNLLQTYNGVFK